MKPDRYVLIDNNGRLLIADQDFTPPLIVAEVSTQSWMDDDAQYRSLGVELVDTLNRGAR